MARNPKEQLSAPNRRNRKPGPARRLFGAFTAVLMLLAIAIAGVVIALALSYEPPSVGDKNIKIAARDGKKSKLPETANNQDKTQPEKKQPDKNSDLAAKISPDKKIPKDPVDKSANKADPGKDKGKAKDAGKTTKVETGKVSETKTTKLPNTMANNADGSLTKAPLWDIHDRGKKGPVPKIATDGRNAFKVYARGHKVDNKPIIAMVIANLGSNSQAINSAIKGLPAEITLAFSPYAENLQANVDAARQAGHEVLLEIPMEPLTYPNDDPGPLAMLTGLPARINLERLEWTMGKFAGYIGAISKMGGRFGNSEPALRPVLQRLNSAGLMFVDNRSSNTPIPVALADKIGLPRAYVDRLIDRRPTRTAIENRLAELEIIAQAQGVAVGRGFAYPVTIERLVVWSQRLSQSGIRLAPVSAIAGKQPLVN